jgi:hypothetical protein
MGSRRETRVTREGSDTWLAGDLSRSPDRRVKRLPLSGLEKARSATTSARAGVGSAGADEGDRYFFGSKVSAAELMQ